MSKEEMIPRYRFKEFTENWETKKIGELGTIIGGGTPSTNNRNYWNGDIPWISSSDISEDKIYDINYNKYITSEAIENSATKLIEKDSILIVTRVGLGKLAINKKAVCTSQDFANLKLNNSDNKFISYVLKDEKNEIYRRSRGTTIKGITNEDLKSIQLNIPVYKEQQKIGDLFEKLDQAISLQQQVLEATKDYKQSMLQKMFPKKGEKVPEIRYKDFKEKWKLIKLKELGTFYNGLSGKNKTSFIDGNKKYIQYLNIFNNTIIDDSFTDYAYVKIDTVEKQNQVKYGDILFTQSSETLEEIGYNSVYLGKQEIYLNSFSFGLSILQDNIDPIFIGYLLRTSDMRKSIMKEGQGATRINLSSNRLKNIIISVPSLEEQQKIGSFFKTLDEKIEQEEKKLEIYKSMKKALMQRMFV